MTFETTVRRAALDDAASLARLGAESFPGNFSDREPPPDMYDYIAQAFSVEQQTAELREDGSSFLIAEIGGRPAGYARLRRNPTPSGTSPPSALEIERLYVLQAATGRRIGSTLLEACLAEGRLRSEPSVWLGAWSENERAIEFYRRHGFEQAGTKEFLLGRERHLDLVLVRRLD